MAANNSQSDFSNLPNEILDLCVQKLIAIEDIIRFGSVCKSWNSVFVETKKSRQLFFAPWLMLSPPEEEEEEEEEKEPSSQRFFSFSNNKILDIELPYTKGRKCWGSPHGWLFTIGVDLNISLFNPLSRVQLSLPSQSTFNYHYAEEVNFRPPQIRTSFINKFAVSSNPSVSSADVMVIFGDVRYLAVARSGDTSWTTVEDGVCYKDIIYYNGQFFATKLHGELVVCEINDSSYPKAFDFGVAPPDDAQYADKFYLVEFSGHLHMVERTYRSRAGGYLAEELAGEKFVPSNDITYTTEDFAVYRLDFSTKTWIYVDDLGNYALFVGNNISFAISTLDYPEFKPHSIYFSDDHLELTGIPSCDMGVFDYVDDGAVETNIYAGTDILNDFTRPIFFRPSF